MTKWISVAALVLLIGEAAAQNPPAGAADFVRGQKAIRKRDNSAAIRAFERALDANRDLILSHYYLGYAYQKNRDWDKTGEHFVEFLQRVDKEDPTATLMVFHATRQGGLALARTERSNEAIPYLKEIISAEADDKDAHFFLGLALFKNDDSTQADKHFTKVIELDQAYVEAYYYAGRIAYDREDVAAANERLGRLLNLQPKSPHAAEAHFMLGSLAITEAETAQDPTEARAKARTHFEKYLTLEPSGAEAEEIKKLLEDVRETKN